MLFLNTNKPNRTNIPSGRHFHPSASNCCYCNRKSVKICAICGRINLKRYFLKNIIPTDEIVPTDELSSHRLQIIFHAEEHGLFRTRINRIERIFHPVHISKWRQNHVLTEACRICHKWRILTCWTIWLFIQIRCLFMHLCRSKVAV